MIAGQVQVDFVLELTGTGLVAVVAELAFAVAVVDLREQQQQQLLPLFQARQAAAFQERQLKSSSGFTNW